MKRVNNMLPTEMPNKKAVRVEGSVGILFFMLTLLCLGACSPKHSSYSEFKDIPADGWTKADPCVFIPHFGDSTASYRVKMAICFEHSYPYRNISIVADFMKQDSLVERKIVDCTLADVNGNWQSDGFGVAYQHEAVLADNVEPCGFDKLILWQGMDCDKLSGITRVGITAMLASKE